MDATFFQQLTTDEQHRLNSLDAPVKIQAYLDSLPYVAEELDRSPLQVLRDRQCHCLDGALFAAAALRHIGFPARIINLVPEPGQDDDHVLAIYQIDGLYGAVAKSNYPGLRFREAIHRSLRELALTYFEFYFNLENQKTLRGYTRALSLARFDRFHWETELDGVRRVVKGLYELQTIPLFPPQAAARFSPLDERALHANLVGVNLAESYGNR